MRKLTFLVIGLTLIFSLVTFQVARLVPVSQAQGNSDNGKKKSDTVSKRGNGKKKAVDPAGIQRLKDSTGGKAKVSVSDATGTVRFARLGRGQGSLAKAERTASSKDKAASFLREYGSIFGVTNPDAELKVEREATDAQGGKHITYKQVYKGVPVFAGTLKAHFDSNSDLTAVNGATIPEIYVNPNPSRSQQEAAAAALATVANDQGASEGLSAASIKLYIYRTGLAEGLDGENHLAYEVEVGNGADVREFVYVDAHSGKVVDRLPGIIDGMFRRAYDGMNLPIVPPTYPASPYWVEGDPFPTASTEANNMILASKETYDFYFLAFGRDSFDGAGAIMDAIFNRGYSCPNASWNGVFISFCPGMTSDDVTGHEWTHAYTQYTHGLIYAWQPGALNESYSDIYGETIDLINGRGTDSPGGLRTAAACSTFTPLPPTVTVNSPPAIAGVKPAGTAAFGPQIFTVTNDVVLADDGVAGGTLSDGCCAAPSFNCAPNSWPNAAAVAGKFALVDRGTCGFEIKVRNAQANGAVGVIVANNTAGIINMAGDALPDPTIPALSILQSDGTAIKTQLLTTTVNTTLSRGATGTDNSVRWLVGEDDTAPGLTGALRDMWSPNCYGNPGKVSDADYGCSTGDNGGVHDNSGVPNHAYALIVDGGTYNSQTISGIGLTKAAHIYFRAMDVYQHSASDFPDHADAIEQSATDLIGVNLADLLTGAPSGQIITAADVAEVQKAMLAVEMRTPPTQCGFQPLLGQNPPPDPACGPGTAAHTVFADDFEGNTSSWTASYTTASATFTPRNWSVSNTLPDGRAGSAFYAPDPTGGTCTPAGDETGVLHLTSPAISMPAGMSGPTLTFEHWVATEALFDGGQLMISVNGGPYTLVPQANFIYNGYNATLAPAPTNTNPRAGQRAWSGTDAGSVDGSWGKTIVDLTGLVAAGDNIQLRWDLSTDGCGGRFGWYVDDVRLYDCETDTDGDGVADPYDNCPTTPNPSQGDWDNDGIGDACDPPSSKDQCKNGGWANFIVPRTFNNQGDCIQWFNTGK